MADRKVLIKYYPPDFNPERLIRNPKQTDKQDHVRMMLPFSLKCYTCGNYLYIGTKFNMRKETCEEDYLGIPILRFYMKCTYCYSEITVKTDPKNHDYICENGGSRNYEAWRDARAAEHTLIQMKEDEEKGNAMKFLENRTKTSKREMDILDALDEMKNMSRQNAKIETDQLFEFLDKRDAIKLSKEEEEKIAQRIKRNKLGKFEQSEADLLELHPIEGVKEDGHSTRTHSDHEQISSTEAQTSQKTNGWNLNTFKLKKKHPSLAQELAKQQEEVREHCIQKPFAFCDYSDDEEIEETDV